MTVIQRLRPWLAGLLLAGCAAASAQTFPSRPVTLLVPYPAGGLSDVIARSVNNALSKQLGQPVIVENLGGASGSIAAQKLLAQPADGHMVFQGSPNELILAPLAMGSIKFKSEDFRLVHPEAGYLATLRLERVQCWQAGALQGCAVHFSGPDIQRTAPDTYGLEHRQLGRFSLRLGPVQRGGDGACRYEALITRMHSPTEQGT